VVLMLGGLSIVCVQELRALKVAAIDVSKNDVLHDGYKQHGLPTLYLSRPGQRHTPVRMQLKGNTSVIGQMMMDFLIKHLVAAAAGNDRDL
jgi:hypothetical protein